ncbi:hypothetical protein KO317_03625 [Candidatus Micrarchaeota archaeon]|nr:hypothetical protein [Candidatus Micrarchaeota archaeon]
MPRLNEVNLEAERRRTEGVINAGSITETITNLNNILKKLKDPKNLDIAITLYTSELEKIEKNKEYLEETKEEHKNLLNKEFAKYIDEIMKITQTTNDTTFIKLACEYVMEAYIGGALTNKEKTLDLIDTLESRYKKRFNPKTSDEYDEKGDTLTNIIIFKEEQLNQTFEYQFGYIDYVSTTYKMGANMSEDYANTFLMDAKAMFVHSAWGGFVVADEYAKPYADKQKRELWTYIINRLDSMNKTDKVKEAKKRISA